MDPIAVPSLGHHTTSVAQQMSNGLDLLVFRFKAKELIYTLLYSAVYSNIPSSPPPNASSPSRSPPTTMVIYLSGGPI
jgi:hypothetical protein